MQRSGCGAEYAQTGAPFEGVDRRRVLRDSVWRQVASSGTNT
jgi:hypothetical protein